MTKIIASCDPYNARTHYHGEKVMEYDGSTPVQWVMGEYANIDEAKGALWGFALEECNRYDDLSHEDDYSIEDWIKSISDGEDMDEDGMQELRDSFSWYKGEGVYYNDSHEPMMLKGDTSYSYDTMGYWISE